MTKSLKLNKKSVKKQRKRAFGNCKDSSRWSYSYGSDGTVTECTSECNELENQLIQMKTTLELLMNEDYRQLALLVGPPQGVKLNAHDLGAQILASPELMNALAADTNDQLSHSLQFLIRYMNNGYETAETRKGRNIQTGYHSLESEWENPVQYKKNIQQNYPYPDLHRGSGGGGNSHDKSKGTNDSGGGGGSSNNCEKQQDGGKYYKYSHKNGGHWNEVDKNNQLKVDANRHPIRADSAATARLNNLKKQCMDKPQNNGAASSPAVPNGGGGNNTPATNPGNSPRKKYKPVTHQNGYVYNFNDNKNMWYRADGTRDGGVSKADMVDSTGNSVDPEVA